MKVLYIMWESYMAKGAAIGMAELGIDLELGFCSYGIWKDIDRVVEETKEKISGSKYDLVFTINFIPGVAIACNEMNISYVSWIYDSPIDPAYEEYMLYDTNMIYTFDRGQIDLMAAKGINMRHCPLGAEMNEFQQALDNSKGKKYDISFVGKIYANRYVEFGSYINDYYRGYLDGIVSGNEVVNTGAMLYSMFPPSIVDSINSVLKNSIYAKEVNLEQLVFLCQSEITRIERSKILNMLAEDMAVALFSADKIDNPKINEYGKVAYYEEMPFVFRSSKINLNISLRSIITGIPLRCMDIMASGGFLMSNSQEELLENFKIGEEIEVYSSYDELREKAKFYLANDSLREKIALNGYEAVQNRFSFKKQMGIIMYTNIY